MIYILHEHTGYRLVETSLGLVIHKAELNQNQPEVSYKIYRIFLKCQENSQLIKKLQMFKLQVFKTIPVLKRQMGKEDNFEALNPEQY